MIGTRVQPRRPRITSRPSMPGSPRSRTTRSGCLRAASVSAASPVGGEVDVVAARAQVRRRARAGSGARRRRRGCGVTRRARSLSDDREPAAGRVLDLELAAHRLDEALRDREAEPDARRRAGESPSRWNGSNRRSRSRGGRRARGRSPAGRRRRRRRPAVDPTRDARRASTRPRSRSRSRAPARAGRGRRARAAASRARRLDDVGAAPRLRERRRDHLFESDRSRRSISSAPVWSRLMSSRLPTSRSAGRSPRRSSRGTRAAPPASSRRRAGAGSSPTP